MANISPFELTEAFTMENFNNRIQIANAEINNLDTKINNLDTNKQNKDTAITTANIGSQSVNYANGAGNADTLDGYHADGLIAAAVAGGVKFQTGSYVGTGVNDATTAEAPDVELTFPFTPKVVIVTADYSPTPGSSNGWFFNPRTSGGYEGNEISCVWGYNSLKWFCDSTRYTAEYRLNRAGATYYYYAFG